MARRPRTILIEDGIYERGQAMAREVKTSLGKIIEDLLSGYLDEHEMQKIVDQDGEDE